MLIHIKRPVQINVLLFCINQRRPDQEAALKGWVTLQYNIDKLSNNVIFLDNAGIMSIL